MIMIEDSKFIHFIPFPQSVDYKWWSLVRSFCFELQKKLLMSLGSFKIKNHSSITKACFWLF